MHKLIILNDVPTRLLVDHNHKLAPWLLLRIITSLLGYEHVGDPVDLQMPEGVFYVGVVRKVVINECDGCMG